MQDEDETPNDRRPGRDVTADGRSSFRLHSLLPSLSIKPSLFVSHYSFLSGLLVRAVMATLVLVCIGASVLGQAERGVWLRQRSGTMAWLHAVYFVDERKGWAVGGGGMLLATDDGGANWRVQPRPTDDALRDLYFADSEHGWLVCERPIYQLKTKDEARTYLLSTADGGSSWKRVELLGKADSDARLVRALFGPEGRGWAFGEAGALYTTHDNGSTWLRQTVPTRHLLLGGTFLDSERGWLVGAGATILQTADGGQTWRTSASLADPRVRLTAVSFVNSRLGWAVGFGGRIFATNNGGRTWWAQNSNVSADLLDVKFTSATEGWACGTEGTLLHTTDGGARWLSEASGTTHPLERLFFINSTRGWAVGFGGTIITYDRSRRPQTPELRGQR